MTREDVQKIFPNATDEEITKMLNAHHAEMPKAKVSDDELTALREKAQKYDAYEADKLSSEEKAKKALEEAETLRVTNLKLLNRTKALAELVGGGLTSDEADSIVDSFVTDDEEKTVNAAKSFSKLLKAKSEATAQKAKEDFLKDTPRPSEGGDNPKPDDMTTADKLAAELMNQSAAVAKAGQDTLKFYTN